MSGDAARLVIPKHSKKLNYFENNKEISSKLQKCLKNLYTICRNIILRLILNVGGKGDWDFWISDLAKILMELIFYPCGEFQ